jgi:hypothetical protein
VPSQAQGNSVTISGTVTVGGSAGHKRRNLNEDEDNESDIVLVSNFPLTPAEWPVEVSCGPQIDCKVTSE